MLKDVSQSKENQPSDHDFQRDVDCSPVILWITDITGSCTYVSRQWYAETGQEPGQGLDFGWVTAIHPDDQGHTRDAFIECVNQRLPVSHEFRIRSASGDYRWVVSAGNPRISVSGQFLGYVGTVIDIHDSKIAQEELAKSKARYKLLFDHSPLPKWIFDVETFKFLDVNQTAIRVYGYSREEFLSMRISDIRPKEDVEVFEKVMRENFQLERSYLHRNYRHLKKDGSLIYVEVSTHDILLNGRRARLAVVVDVTKRVEVEAQQKELMAHLHAAKEHAERANELKSAFLANMSHEIRTPLGAILGFADLLKDPDLSEDERLSYLNIINRNGTQLAAVIDDILDLAKVESGHLKTTYERVNPLQVVEEVISLLSLKASQKRIVLETTFADTVPTSMVTDSSRLRQILINVVGNAIKFTVVGKITIAVSVFKDFNGDRLHIEVTDTGVGIAEKDLPNLFKPFSQADNSLTRKFGGTGLGLVLSKALANLLGGDLFLQSSKEGQGSTFVIEVAHRPAHLKEQKAALAADAQVSRWVEDQLSGKRILLVEDSPDNQQLVSLVLKKQGANIEVASNGIEGVQKALAGSYDIVLMDIQMPVLDGYTATQRLRDLGYRKPIIALTAHAMTEVRSKCMDVGCNDHLPKPINPQQLLLTISKWTHH